MSAPPTVHPDVLAAVFAHANVGIFCIGEDGLLAHVNPAMARLLGYQQEELLGVHFTRIAPPEVVAVADRFLDALLSQSERIFPQWRAVHRDGSLIPAEATFNTIPRADGRRMAVITLADARRQQAVEAQLRASNDELEARVVARTADLAESEEKYRNLIDRAPVGMCVSVAGVIRLANRHLAGMLGVTAAGLIGQQLIDFTHPEDHSLVMRQRQRREAGAEVRAYEVRMMPLAAPPIWVEITGAQIDWEGESASLLYLKDVSEQRVLQDSLAESLTQRDVFFDSTTVGVFFSRHDAIVWHNRALAQMLGYPEGGLAGAAADQLFADQAAYVAARDEANRQMATDVGYAMDVPLKRADGSSLWVNLNARPIDPRHPEAGKVGTLVDISERRRLQSELADSLAMRDIYLDMASVGVGFFKDGWIVWNNRTLERLLGYEAGELVGQPTTVFYPSEAVYQWALSETMQQIEATGACSFDVEMITKSGAQRFINLNARAIDRNDFSKGRVWTFIDITERNSLRQQLAQSLAERDAYLDLAAVGVSLVREGRITWHNRTFARILGYDGEDLTGRPPAMVYANDAVAKAAAERALKEIAEHGSCLLDVEMVKKDGRPVSIELYGRELQPGMPESGRVWTFIDITERRRAEEEVRRALDRERELVATRARLVAMASHEFRTPLATLLSAAEILEHYGDRLGRDERREVINDISGAVKRMQAMLDNVINMGQREGRPLAFKPAPVDARTLTRKVFDEMHSLDQGEHQLELTMTRIPVPAARAFLDEELVRTILANLIGNACKYTPTDGRVKVSLQRMASGLAFEVRDDGIGIPETEQAQLFESFFRGSNVGAAAGTGIGLAVAKRAVDAHGGRISVASQVGKGSVFRVELPQPGTLQ